MIVWMKSDFADTYKYKYINVDQNANIRARPSLLASRLQINQCFEVMAELFTLLPATDT